MTLPVEEFLRRFLLHGLPSGFVRIRHFGFVAHRRRAALLPLCFQFLAGCGKSPFCSKTDVLHKVLQYLLLRELPFANRIDGTGLEHTHYVFGRELPGIESHWHRAISRMSSKVPQKADAILRRLPHRPPLAIEERACLGQTLHGPTQAFLGIVVKLAIEI